MPEMDFVAEKILAGIVGHAAALQFAQFCKKSRGLSAEKMLNGFAGYKAALEKAKAHELTALSESAFRYIEAEKDAKARGVLAKNFGDYVSWLHLSKRREALAHWLTVFDTDNYPLAKVSIMMSAPSLMQDMASFIKSIQL